MGAFGYPASIDFDDVGNRTFRMPRRYSNGGRVNPGAADRMPGGPPLPDPRTLKERFGALGNLRPFLAMVWRTSPSLTMASLALRLVRALLPVATLFVGKLIIDEVVLLVQTPDKPGTFQAWLDSGLANRLGVLLLIEFALAVLADVLGRVVSLLDSPLSERVSNVSSVRLGEAHYNAQSYSHAGAARTRLRAPDRRQRRNRQGSEDLRPQRLSHRALPQSRREILCRQSPARAAACELGRRADRDRHDRLLPRLRQHRLAHAGGRIHDRRSHLPRRLVPSPAQSARRPVIEFSSTAGQALYLDDLFSFEWQKIAIARTYMREADVLVLDEPTAALDARSEFEVFRRFKELSAGKTAILISHRFSSVRMVDRILVLADGKVEAAGTHEELLGQAGRYAELFELQAAGYR
jgi:hypothetical protein